MTLTRFSCGRLVITPGAREALAATGESSMPFLLRHATGDWGDLVDCEKQANDKALAEGGRILSEYHTADGTKFWILTESDRSVTTFLLPSEY
jgi:hypothetical protein